jgi:hypothetical protein
VDSVRGGTKYIISESTNAEGTLGVAQLFTSTGMTISNDASANSLNSSASSKVSWGWKANGAGVANTAGTISSTVSANTTSGFSIVTYTGNGTSGATVGHGLGTAPSFIIQKGRSVVDDWLIYSKARTANNGLALNNTTAEAASSGYWNNTEPTSSVFSIGNNGKVNTSGGTHVAYCFAEVKGFSKFGSYVGNGNANGPFVYTGFKPAMVIAKRTDSTGNWRIRDNKRSANNVITDVLYPNTSASTITEDDHDFLSNGFKVRTTGPENNASGGTFIYMAFAENPLVGTNNIPATAR